MRPLQANEVAVVFARPDSLDDRRRADALGKLPTEDVAHVRRFRFERDRDIALASRTLQRRALSRHAPVSPELWRFDTTEHGRPEIAAPSSDLRFNVSNTHGLVACAVTLGREVGIDVEQHRDDAPLDLVDSHFAPVERTALRALPAGDRARRFLELWTLKEAYIKARGLGLALPLDRFWFDLDGPTPRLSIAPELEDDASTWQLALWRPTPTHYAALCVRNTNTPLAIDSEWDVV